MCNQISQDQSPTINLRIVLNRKHFPWLNILSPDLKSVKEISVQLSKVSKTALLNH